MKIAIVYDSRTGTTKAAAVAMGQLFEEKGHRCTVQSVADADPAEVSRADVICVGSWTQGFVFVLQHATKACMRFVDRLGDLRGKKAIVFCTYKIATGSMLPRMSAALESRGAEVVARLRYRGPAPTAGFYSLVASMAAPRASRSRRDPVHTPGRAPEVPT